MSKKGTEDAPPLTQDTEHGTSTTDYNWLITFNWQNNAKKSFELYQRTCFSGREVPTIWYTKVLSKDCRLKKLKLSGLSGDFYSVFCKIATGNEIN